MFALKGQGKPKHLVMGEKILASLPYFTVVNNYTDGKKIELQFIKKS